MDRARAGEPGPRLQALVGLGQEGVGGGFRGGYLQRRLARETGGEVEFEWLTSGDCWGRIPPPRTINLTRMRAVIMAWRDRWGLSFEQLVPIGEGEGCSNSIQEIRQRNDERGRAGLSSSGAGNVVPFDATLSMPPPGT